MSVYILSLIFKITVMIGYPTAHQPLSYVQLGMHLVWHHYKLLLGIDSFFVDIILLPMTIFDEVQIREAWQPVMI